MKRLTIAAAALLTFLAPAIAADNYTATQGSGKTFGCKDVAGVCLPEWLPVDSTAALFGVVGNPFFVTVTGTMPLPTGASTAALQTTGNTALTTINTTLGTPMQATGGTVTANLGTIGAAATAANQATEISSLATIASNTGAAVPAGTAHIGTVGTTGYPDGATAITASATGTTGATTATLAGTSGKTTYICGYSIRANATAAATVTNTITGVITATLSSVMWVAPLASGLGIDEQVFYPCIPASASNTGIAIVSGAPGTGGTVSSKGWGYQL